ncbi:hypothetical protein GCM10023332_04880 [Luteimonas vadosa]|uniref:Uncharacterized protein n=1 Tax=Luteimonas vadosa TaxID=1165507 RepID=A0ABP9DQ96_9GAMM
MLWPAAARTKPVPPSTAKAFADRLARARAQDVVKSAFILESPLNSLMFMNHHVLPAWVSGRPGKDASRARSRSPDLRRIAWRLGPMHSRIGKTSESF